MKIFKKFKDFEEKKHKNKEGKAFPYAQASSLRCGVSGYPFS